MASSSDGKQVLEENNSQVSGAESKKKCEKKLSWWDKIKRALFSKEEQDAIQIEKLRKDNKDKNKRTGCQ